MGIFSVEEVCKVWMRVIFSALTVMERQRKRSGGETWSVNGGLDASTWFINRVGVCGWRDPGICLRSMLSKNGESSRPISVAKMEMEEERVQRESMSEIMESEDIARICASLSLLEKEGPVQNSKNWDLRKSVSINAGVNAINEVEVSEGGVLAVIDERILEDQVVLGNRVEETGFGCDPVGGEIPASVDLNG
ncbi:hypothetical protein QYF36_003945 [Acer negundo]|nr:hypothetical protein QYF36_003945 [Acer negundo]